MSTTSFISILYTTIGHDLDLVYSTTQLAHGNLLWLNTIYDKTSKGKSFTARQPYSLCKEIFCSLPTTTYFSILIMKQENIQS